MERDAEDQLFWDMLAGRQHLHQSVYMTPEQKTRCSIKTSWVEKQRLVTLIALH